MYGFIIEISLPPLSKMNEQVLKIICYITWKFSQAAQLESEYFLLWDHPYIMSACGLSWRVKKMAIFADVQYYIYADILVGGGVQKSPKSEDVIFGWSLSWIFTMGPKPWSTRTEILVTPQFVVSIEQRKFKL